MLFKVTKKALLLQATPILKYYSFPYNPLYSWNTFS